MLASIRVPKWRRPSVITDCAKAIHPYCTPYSTYILYSTCLAPKPKLSGTQEADGVPNVIYI